MAGKATTHVIEIEKGVGEPTFIPLSVGSELAPISVGRRGMWRIEGAKVLDVHAFVYFDGQSLFVQSADSSQAALAEGTPIGSTWTELRAPCRIDIGSARLSYRSLIEEDPAEGVATVAREVSVEERDAFAREVAARRNLSSVPAPPVPPRPKGDRPFAHGELAAKSDSGESTRYNPVVEPPLAGPPRAMPPRARTISGPFAAPPMHEDSRADSSRRGGPSYPQSSPPSGPSPSRPPQGQLPSYVPQQAPQPGYASPSGIPPQGPPMMMQGQGGGTMPGLGGMPQMQQMPMMQSGGYPGMPGGGYPGAPGMPAVGTGPGPMMMPNNGAQTILVAAQGGNKLDDLIAQFKHASPVRKAAVILGPFSVLAALFVLLSDDSGPADTRTPTSATSTVIVLQPTYPPGTPTPGAPGVPQPGYPNVAPTVAPSYRAPIGGTAVPAYPPTAQPFPTAPQPQPAPTPQPAPQPTAPIAQPQPGRAQSTITSGPPTTERRAVDAVLSGDTSTALALYAQLMHDHPENPAFADAVRILQARVDAGSPR